MVTATQREQYIADGYCVIPGLIPSEIFQPVRERVLETLETPPEWFTRACPVSYTHPRAHATLRYLACRLLLEKKMLSPIPRIVVSSFT